VQAGKPAIGGSLAGNIFHEIPRGRRFLLSVSCRELQAGSSLRSPDIRELYWGA